MIELSGNPKSTQQCYRHSNRATYMTTTCHALKTSYQYQAKEQWKKPPTKDDLVVVVTLYFGDKRKRDIDNFNKLWMDALEGVVYEDDSQIRQLTISKDYDKENPRIEIYII